MDKILYGTAYYYEYLPTDRLAKDIEMMKKAHLNIVRIGESTWGTYEKQSGVFDFSPLDKVLDAMGKAGISVIVGTPTYAIPTWLAREHPEIMVQQKEERLPYGARQIMDITSPAYLFYGERIIRKMLEHINEHPAIIGYQVDNETKSYGTSSSNVQAGFVKYIKKEFNNDIEKFNREFGLDYWSNRINSWEDFPSMDGTINGSLGTEFAKYQRQLVTDYLKWQVNIVNEYKKSKQFVTHNFDFEWRDYSYGIQPDVNHFDAAETLDFVGTDIYHPSQSKLTGTEISFAGDLIRSIKHKSYLVLETQAQAFKDRVPYPGQLRLSAYSHIASGANMIEYWHWHSTHNSFETYWKGILSHDSQSNPIYEEIQKTGSELENISSSLVNLNIHADVCILVSNQSLTAINWFPFSENKNYNDIFRRLYDPFYKLNIRTDISDENHIKPSDYKLIVVPSLYSVSDKVLEKLNDYVENGGHVIYMFKSGFTDEHVKVRTSIQPAIIEKTAGVHYELFVTPDDLDAKLKPSLEGPISSDDNLHLDDWMELLIPDSAKTLANYDHPVWKKYAAITENNYGKGQVVYIGCLPSENVINDLIKDQAEQLHLTNKNSPKYPIVVKTAKNIKNENLTFYLNYSDKKQILPSQISKVDIFTNQVGKNFESIPPWGVKIFKNKEKEV
ncbi:beta-galactosidase [Oenococcus oeni]|uniref:Beta-galactosidase n=46 Tax=Oenococcus oeni TaxID=1247 RepID=D3LC04_OENOE|nr:beta-galactosidase [Oenococcus oeni]AWW98818.1 beta-galactosidase [Oenococcus oeni]EFD87610.1 hypothetical protein AWRIB429_1884 [Oenococcus oeni AWRIB429]EJN91506.1 Beta-galactosidase [Oenococcus oeni AWRIB304]EJN99677.1 Beta-galactosidase [Oenococcus oeni AWRIB419]EJO03052.1 Beta-galactosidase [Oenococcus oeni AWRIB318]